MNETDTTRFSDEAETCEECKAEEFTLNEFGLIEGPGKFEGEPLSTYHAWHTSLDGGADEGCGDSETTGWYGLVGNVIICQVSSGFVSGTVFDTDELALQAFVAIQDEIESEEDDDDSN